MSNNDETGERLARIETKLDMMLIAGNGRDKQHEDHENRLRTVEQRQWTVAGGVAALSVAMHLAAKKLGFV